MKVKSQLYITCEDILKVKQSLLQAWTGLEGSRKLRLPDIKAIGT